MNPTDEYMTPPSAWEAIQKYIPKNKVIWEAFYGDGKSGDALRTLGFKVNHDELDFFENNLGVVIVSNPPFSKLPQILERLAHLNKPFIIIMPSSKLNTQQYFKKFCGQDTNHRTGETHQLYKTCPRRLEKLL